MRILRDCRALLGEAGINLDTWPFSLVKHDFDMLDMCLESASFGRVEQMSQFWKQGGIGGRDT